MTEATAAASALNQHESLLSLVCLCSDNRYGGVGDDGGNDDGVDDDDDGTGGLSLNPAKSCF